MSRQRTNELLYDSAAALRLLEHELGELREGENDVPDATPPAAPAPGAGGAATLADLSANLQRANAEITGVLASMKASRTALEQGTVQRLQHTNEKLREVTSTTEVAATDILDALERALGLVDEMDQADVDGARDRGTALRAGLREELFGMMSSMQFQDITAQQISYASSTLTDMETRLTQIAAIFDVGQAGGQAGDAPLVAAPAPDSSTMAFDPNATMKNAEQRQAVADEIFVGPTVR